MLQWEHSAILLTLIKLLFVIKNFFGLFMSGRFTQVLLFSDQLMWYMCQDEPHRRHCVVVLDQDTFILA